MTKSIREILERLKFKAHPYNPEDEDKRAYNRRVDQALKDISAWLESRKKDMADVDIYAKQTYREYKEWNACIDELKGELK